MIFRLLSQLLPIILVLTKLSRSRATTDPINEINQLKEREQEFDYAEFGRENERYLEDFFWVSLPMSMSMSMSLSLSMSMSMSIFMPNEDNSASITIPTAQTTEKYQSSVPKHSYFRTPSPTTHPKATPKTTSTEVLAPVLPPSEILYSQYPIQKHTSQVPTLSKSLSKSVNVEIGRSQVPVSRNESNNYTKTNLTDSNAISLDDLINLNKIIDTKTTLGFSITVIVTITVIACLLIVACLLYATYKIRSSIIPASQSVPPFMQLT